MNRTTVCNKCGWEFVISEAFYGKIEADDLEVQYFHCPRCKEKYQIITTDTTMRKLIAERKSIDGKMKAARQKKFREKTLKEYVKRLNEIEAEQKKLFPELFKKGEKILEKECGRKGAEYD